MSTSLYSHLCRKFGEAVDPDVKRDQIDKQNLALDRVHKYYLEESSLSTKKKVIVVGAGFAGLSAAYHLGMKGFSVTVIEARERVGGRVHSRRDDLAKGQIIEAGAELIGSNHQLWIKFARKYGLGMSVVTQDANFMGAKLHIPFYQHGKVSNVKAKRLYDLMDIILSKKMVRLSKQVNASHPWRSKGAARLDNISLSDWLDKEVAKLKCTHKERLSVREALEFEFSNNNSVSTAKQSLLGVLSQISGGGGQNYWTMTEVYRCSDGNDALAQHLQQSVLSKKNQVLLNNPVKAIRINKNGVVVTDSKDKIHEADYIILATPPTTWHLIDMSSSITERSTQMGKAIKYLSVLKKRFWIEPGVAPSGSADTLGMIWEGSDNQSFYADKQVEMTVFSGGQYADRILKLKDPARDAYYQKELNKIYPGYDKNKVRTHLQNWPEEKWTKAGYSCPNVGQVTTKVKALNECLEDRLYFAGEHICLAFCGYMEGALQSGLFAASRIAQREKAINKKVLI